MAEKEESKDEEIEDTAPAASPADPTTSKVDEAKDLLKKIERANEETRSWVERAEQLKAESIISGDSEAGRPADKPKEESPEDYAKRVIANDI